MGGSPNESERSLHQAKTDADHDAYEWRPPWFCLPQAFSFTTLISFRNSLSQDLMTQADIIGYNSAAAMAFKDEASATVTLSPSRPSKTSYRLCYIHATEKSSPTILTRTPPRHLFPALHRKEVIVFKQLSGGLSRRRSKRGTLGTLFLQSDMRQWNLRAKRYASIFLSFVLISGFFALLVSSKLQKLIFRAHFAPRRHDENGFRHKKLRSSSHQILRRRNRKADRRVQYDVVRNSASDMALHHANDELKTRTMELEGENSPPQGDAAGVAQCKARSRGCEPRQKRIPRQYEPRIAHSVNAIIGYSEMLEEETHELGKLENVKDLQKIQGAGKHLLSLINDVLDLSKIEAGRMGLHLETFDISQMINEMVTTLIQRYRRTQCYPGPRGRGTGSNASRYHEGRQILFNLLSNACNSRSTAQSQWMWIGAWTKVKTGSGSGSPTRALGSLRNRRQIYFKSLPRRMSP